MAIERRTSAVVHTERLAANIENIRRRLAPGAEIIAVLKADAYGHGIENIYPTLRDAGVRRYAVALWEEGAALRRAGAETESILLLGDTWDGSLGELIQWRLTPTIFAVETAEKLNALAAAAGVVQPIQLKIDTGMHRIGFPAGPACFEAVERVAAMEHLSIEGAFTHYPCADDDEALTRAQLKSFLDTVSALRARGVAIPFLHSAGSPSLLMHPWAHLDGVRVGDLLYGLSPFDDETEYRAMGFQEVMTWHTYAALVKDVAAGERVGYGGTYTAPRDIRLATLPVGFADGYSRRLSNIGSVIIRGQEAPIRGRVCMDQMMVDVTDIPGVRRGDEVTLLGGPMNATRMAALSGLSIDEVVCNISRRVPRVRDGA